MKLLPSLSCSNAAHALHAPIRMELTWPIAAAVAAGGGILIAAKDEDSGALRIESRGTD